MRKWASLALVLTALVFAEPALADTPPDVYNDYAQDGVLTCGHSRSALEGALKDASIHQYGDPLTVVGLKFAVRKQLAGGCRRSDRTPQSVPVPGSVPPPPAAPPESESEPPASTEKSAGGAGKDRQGGNQPPNEDPIGNGARAIETAGGGQDGWMILLGVGLLLITLGSGGWAARRAFTE